MVDIPALGAAFISPHLNPAGFSGLIQQLYDIAIGQELEGLVFGVAISRGLNRDGT